MKKYFVILVGILLSLCSCVSIPDELDVLSSDSVNVAIQRGTSVGSAISGDIGLSLAGNTIDDNVGSFIFGITNFSNDEYQFNDSDISIWGSSSSSGSWKLIEEWDADSFYHDAEREYKSKVFWTGFAGVLNAVNSAMGTYSTSNVYTRYGSATITTRTYSPNDVLLASYVAQSTTDSVKKSGKAYLSFLENNLLFDSTVQKGETYMGWVYFVLKRTYYPYYKVEFTNRLTQEKSQFILEVQKR